VTFKVRSKQSVSPPDKREELSCNTHQQRWEFWQQSAHADVVTIPQSQRHWERHSHCWVLP